MAEDDRQQQPVAASGATRKMTVFVGSEEMADGALRVHIDFGETVRRMSMTDDQAIRFAMSILKQCGIVMEVDLTAEIDDEDTDSQDAAGKTKH